MVLVVFLAVSVSEMPEAKAVMQMRCSSVTVGYGDYTSVQDVCYWVYSGGSGGGRGYAGGFREVGGGGGSGSLRVVTGYNGNNPKNPNRATCKSDDVDREGHAQWDAKMSQARRGIKPYPVGTEIKITYDDGGTEIWIINYPKLSLPLLPIPKPGTLKCPSNNSA